MTDHDDKTLLIAKAIRDLGGLRVRPNMSRVARDAFPIQPMTAPSGAVFYMDYTFRNCTTEGHPGVGKPREECTHPECVVQCVLDS